MLKKIEKIAVIGSGIMGGGIAALCASAGIPVLILDIVPSDLKDEEKKNHVARNRIVNAGLAALSSTTPAALMDKKNDLLLIETGNLEDDFKKLKECDIIFEVIVEDLKIKQSLFAKLEKIRNKDTVIVSNTSGLPLRIMTEGRTKEFKQHFMVMHFFNPVRYMKLLELVKGTETAKEVYELISGFGEKILGKGIVLAKDSPNFIGNRIGIAFILQAFRLLESEKIPVQDADSMFGSVFGFPGTGIFALTDLVGLDTIGHLAENSYNLLKKDEFRDLFKLPLFVTEMLKRKMLGNKTKETGGFYKSVTDPATRKKNKKVINIKTFEHIDFDRKLLPDCVIKAKELKTLAERQTLIIKSSDFSRKLMAFIFSYAANRVPEISDSIAGIDNAMKWGYAWETGPFEIWDNYGIKKSFKLIEDSGFKVPAKIKKMIAGGSHTFYRMRNGKRQYFDFKSNTYKDIITSEKSIFLSNIKSQKKNIVKSNDSASLIDIGDGIFNIEFHSKANAINNAMIDFSAESVQYVKENGTGLVIGNQPSAMQAAFSAGGDVSYMLGLAKAKKYSEIDTFIKTAHSTIMSLKYSPYPVIAAPFNKTLGGGCEICLAADRIVSHAELYMGLVEIGAGLLPGGAGMIHLWERLIESIPRQIKVTDWAAYFTPAFMTVAMAKVSTSAAEARNMGFLRPADRIIFNKDFLIGEAKKEALRMVENGYRPPLKKKVPVMGQAAQGIVWAEIQNMRAGGFIPPHMEFIAKKIAYCMSGGEAYQGQSVSEDYLMKLEREAFVELWKTDNTKKMAEHIMKTGKPLLL
ncbi:MAG: 3-hydroxyacyl-CoA dehydrogenase/enoyl-CoA hydratase family protein [Spirochaetes bacterium]|nr:3-hydroxyacyl-CoA dehydrogenase/enoyl-CoA hydratase family protein [Spirochaetota bacterium]